MLCCDARGGEGRENLYALMGPLQWVKVGKGQMQALERAPGSPVVLFCLVFGKADAGAATE